jgi:metallo-beta-lactamase family protein
MNRWILRIVFAMVMLILAPSAIACDEKKPSDVAVTVHGGAGQVSGSLAMLEATDGTWMIDCGIYYPEVGETAEERQAIAGEASNRLPAGATEVDGVFLTHAHLDHIGRLPLMVRQGYEGPVYATRETIQIAAPMLRMQIRYEAGRERSWSWSNRDRSADYVKAHWNRDCQWANRISSRNRAIFRGTIGELEDSLERGAKPRSVSPCKVCADGELRPVLRLMKPTALYTTVKLGPNAVAIPIDAGHIPGSCSWMFEVDGDEEPFKILFSGDLGGPGSTIIEGPSPAPDADVVFVETTYGCKPVQRPVEDELRAFREGLGEVLAKGGVVWIPSFALDRTQKVLHQIRIAQREGFIPAGIPVVVPSPTAAAVSDVYEAERRGGGFRDEWSKDLTNLTPPGYTRKLDEDSPPEPPVILVTTSGMMESAFSGEFLEEYLPRQDVTVLLVGYQDPFSPGGLLEKDGLGRKDATSWLLKTSEGEEIEVRATIRRFSGFSAHAKANDLDVWLERQDRELTRVMLVHGEASALEERQSCLRETGWQAVDVPISGNRYVFRAVP